MLYKSLARITKFKFRFIWIRNNKYLKSKGFVIPHQKCKRQTYIFLHVYQPTDVQFSKQMNNSLI